MNYHSNICRKCVDIKRCDFKKEIQEEHIKGFIGCYTWINDDGEIECEEILKEVEE
jgi:hypothetical protein